MENARMPEKKMVRGDVDQLPPGGELDALVAGALETMPSESPPEDALERALAGAPGYLSPGGAWIAACLYGDDVPRWAPRRFSTDGRVACEMADRFDLDLVTDYRNRRIARYALHEALAFEQEGDNIPHAVARWVATFVRNGKAQV
jgi:hypothetical protein